MVVKLWKNQHYPKWFAVLRDDYNFPLSLAPVQGEGKIHRLSSRKARVGGNDKYRYAGT